jgi:hypothetical protein
VGQRLKVQTKAMLLFERGEAAEKLNQKLCF